MKYIVLSLSIILHFALFFIQFDKRKVEPSTVIKINLIKKKTSKNRRLRNKKKEQLSAFTQSLLLSSHDGFARNLDLGKEGSAVDDLYQRVNSGLTFPVVFQRFSIQGAVKAKVYFDKDGKFKIKESLFQSKSGFLRFHIMTHLERRLANYKLKTKFNGGFISMTFLFRYTVSGIQRVSLLSKDSFQFEREAFQAETTVATALLEVGQTLISLLNLLKFRPDFLRTNKELQKKQRELNYLNRIRSHPYYK